jgi:flagella basal body P-ring formation protein FlgA
MSRRRFWLMWLTLAVLLWGTEPVQGSLTFKSEAAVAGDYITLGHLAELTPELSQKWGAALIWSAPPPGQVYTLTQEFLQYRLSQLGLTPLLEGVTLPPAILVRQTGVLLPLEDITAAFRRYVLDRSPYPAGNLRIEVFPLEDPVILPDPKVALEPLPPKGGRMLGNVSLEMVVLHQGQPLKRLKVNGKVRLERQVVCAVRPLKPQEVLSPGDIQVARREVTDLNDNDFFTSTEQVIGRTLARPLGPQEILTSRHLSNLPVIKRGEEVTVLLEHEGLEIATKGVAREEGYLGKIIRLLNPKSKKEFQGMVVDAKTVKVKL